MKLASWTPAAGFDVMACVPARVANACFALWAGFGGSFNQLFGFRILPDLRFVQNSFDLFVLVARFATVPGWFVARGTVRLLAVHTAHLSCFIVLLCIVKPPATCVRAVTSVCGRNQGFHRELVEPGYVLVTQREWRCIVRKRPLFKELFGPQTYATFIDKQA